MATQFSSDQLLAMYCDLTQEQKDELLTAIQNGERIGAQSGASVDLTNYEGESISLVSDTGTLLGVGVVIPGVSGVFLSLGHPFVGTGLFNADVDGSVNIWASGTGGTVGVVAAGTITLAAGADASFVSLAEDGDATIHAAELTVDATEIGFYGGSPVAQPAAVAVTAEAIHAALVSLGPITGP